MTLGELKNIVRQGESQFVEFKKKVNHPEKIVKEAVAFANTKGGYLFIGIDDNGELSGLKYAEEDAFEMQKALQTLCKPRLQYEFNLVKLSDKKAVLSFHILESGRKPHYHLLHQKQRWGKALVRVADKSLIASPEMLAILRAQHNQQNVGFHYGPHEARLMQYLDEAKSITLKDFVDISAAKPIEASRILVRLVCANVLKIIPDEKEDKFVLKERALFS